MNIVHVTKTKTKCVPGRIFAAVCCSVFVHGSLEQFHAFDHLKYTCRQRAQERKTDGADLLCVSYCSLDTVSFVCASLPL